MGLDMSLYIEHIEYTIDGYNESINRIFKEDIKALCRTTTYEVGYWRKANHIHNWFVQNCGNGIDECHRIHINIPHLEALLDVCNKVLESPKDAPTLLPTQSGFFFGSIDYNEAYFNKVEDTIKIIKPIIEFMKEKLTNKEYNYEVYYQASW